MNTISMQQLDTMWKFVADSSIWKFVADSTWIPFMSAFSCGYAVYYLAKVVHQPKLFVKPGKFANKLKEHLLVLDECYWPTFWCFSAHLQTILRVILKSKPALPYRREVLIAPDKGHINLDWVDNNEDNQIFADSRTRPTVLIMPGITGHSDVSYVRHLALESMAMGYRSVVFNNRGLGIEAKLQTPRTFCACNSEDLELVLNHLNKELPESPLFIFAVSLGGALLTNYMSRIVGRPKNNIISVLGVSVPMDSWSTTNSLEQPVNWLLYNRHLANKLKRLIQSNFHLFKEQKLGIKLDEVMKSKTIRDFDTHFTYKTFGFDSVDHYYQESSISLRPLHNIQVPMLFLNSVDDPFAPVETLPIKAITQNPNLAMILTQYGGHIGFTEGCFIRGRSFVERLFFQYASCMLENNNSRKVSTSNLDNDIATGKLEIENVSEMGIDDNTEVENSLTSSKLETDNDSKLDVNNATKVGIENITKVDNATKADMLVNNDNDKVSKGSHEQQHLSTELNAELMGQLIPS